MPTGYTAAVQSGEITEFKVFVYRCARNFGALIEMRESPMDAPIPEELKVSDYNSKKKFEAEQKYVWLLSLDHDQRQEEATKKYTEAMGAYEKRAEELKLQVERYNAMLKKAKEWTTPTDDHDGLKEFMISQLVDSIQQDCSGPSGYPYRQNAGEWFEEELIEAKKDIKYHTDAMIKEESLVRSRNEWLKTLRLSVESKL